MTASSRSSGRSLALCRLFVVAAAVFLVGAVALAALLPADLPTSEILAGMDTLALPHLQQFELTRLGGWAWQFVTVPVLVRPIWVLPLTAGIICAGVAATMGWAGTTPRRSRPR